jgi:hypothetical protein
LEDVVHGVEWEVHYDVVAVDDDWEDIHEA